MSLFSWLTQKTAAKAPPDADSSGLGHLDATVPFQVSDRGAAKAPAASPSVGIRKSERLERRELLYGVVRESMIRIGVLSSKYKFKVLSLDSRGSKYLIMMDLAKQHAGEAGRLAEIEGLIAQTAKARHNILVTSVYWRVNEHVTSGLTLTPKTDSAPAPLSASSSAPQHAPASPKPRFEPLLPDEVAAFKQALSSGPTPQKLSSPGEIVRNGRRNQAPMPSFADTEFLDEAQMPLSGTQYGDLN